MSESNLQYPPVDEETGKIICQICGNKYLVISPRHLQKHNLTYDEYKKRYPDAPLSSKEFTAKSKYGKVKDLFAPSEDEELEEVVVDEEPTIEDDLNIDRILEEKSHKDPIRQNKAQILDTLRSYFTNIRQDYIIEEFGKVSGKLKYHFISDFADPVLKIVVQFPNTFWHNRDVHSDPLKYQKLKQDGWKVISFKGKSPTRKDIQKVVDNI